MSEVLQGAYDLHVHVAPDVIRRKCDDRELAQRIQAAGMKGCVIKCHYFETASRATLLRSEFPGLDIAGGLAMNLSMGGINVHAVERFAQMGGGILWFPTMDARSFQEYKHRDDPSFDSSMYIRATDGHRALLPETMAVLEMAARYHLIVATGHLDADEGLCVIREAARLGIDGLIVTHVDNPALQYNDEQQLEAASLGAYIEHSYHDVWFGRCTMDAFARRIRLVGCEHVILTTDSGQANAPYCDESLEECARLLQEASFTDDELRTMMCKNPSTLLSQLSNHN